MRKVFFTSESVTEGHPDKLCDQISDGVLDEVLRNDPHGRVACETYVTMGLLIVGGEITTNSYVDIHKLARKIIKDIGYTHPKFGFDYHTCAVINTIHSQSPDIAQGVDIGGAGDQGLMFGFACLETEEYMPLPITLSQKLSMQLAKVRKEGALKYLGPDGKSQVTVEYRDGKPVRVDTVVLASQHTEEILDKSGDLITQKARDEIIKFVADPILKKWTDKDTKYFINQTGKFLIGGPQSDTGMTGRKIIVDTYGGTVPHGGGAFSGKDPTKVDRSAAYMARYVAKNVVASGAAEKCLLQLAYVIGRAEPVSVMVDTYGTSKVSEEKISKAIRQVFDLTPQGIIKNLDLLKPVYLQTAAYGHFGRPEFAWEKLDKVKELQKAV
ncbi:MAG: methionine adenosyltransferase [Candidatus Omnitrophica bacterium]|nr:methionine adenosyltransferase [Candidatus Omnitrophota bacterium]MDD5654340.1 methionine adenosyltransferase [Candidatus Omnitrophota bacterium]